MKKGIKFCDSSVLNFILFLGICTNLATQMNMIARLATPYVKSLQSNVISQ